MMQDNLPRTTGLGSHSSRPTTDTKPTFGSASNIKTPAADQATIDRIRTLCHQWCGVFLDQSKTYLIRNRLKDLLQSLEVDSLERLVSMAERPTGLAIRDRIVDVLTTHETLFFRDRTPFEAIKQIILPGIKNAAGTARPKLRIWSAACSTGQEPYSLAMAIAESGIDFASWNISIEATDVSAGSIKIAQQGIYADHELARGLSDGQRERFFKPVSDGWQINNEIRRMVRFNVGNLLSANQSRDQFDVIMCRNVAIYFTPEDRRKVFEGLSQRLAADGHLFVGCSEVLAGLNHVLKAETVGRSTCYRRVPSESASPSSPNSSPLSSRLTGNSVSPLAGTSSSARPVS